VLTRVQDLENAGFQFESAEASFELLLRQEIGRFRTFFTLDHYRVTVLKQDSQTPIAEATVKVKIGDVTEHRVAEGSGPVDSLDAAMRKAMRQHYPKIEGLHLIDYKVRVVNTSAETAASVRVVIEWKRPGATDAPEYFGTIGVSSNIIDATWQALADGYAYHLVHVEESAAAS
jgi:2-isopropylmalate synthase